LLLYRRRHQLASFAASPGDGTDPSSFHEATTSLMKPYNPDDPTTFPWFQGAPRPQHNSGQVFSSSSGRNLFTIATSPNSQAQEYHGTDPSSFHEATTSLMKPYNPDDPTTFPGFQGAPRPQYNSAQVSSSSPSGNLITVTTPPNSQAQEYPGLPMV
jgi:hypothetical protein